MRLRGKSQPPVLLGNNHPEETPVLDELPDMRRQIGTVVGNVPIVQHRAQLFDFVIQKRLLCGAQAALGKSQQLIPVGMSAEQLTVPPHRTGINRLLFGSGNGRQDFTEQIEDSGTDDMTAYRGNAKQQNNK